MLAERHDTARQVRGGYGVSRRSTPIDWRESAMGSCAAVSQWQPRVSRQHLALDEDMHAASAVQVLQALGCAPWMAESNAEAGCRWGLVSQIPAMLDRLFCDQ